MNCVCSVCGEKFQSSSDCAKHMKYHTAEKNHECNECGERFYTESVLNQHMKTHTEKNFEQY